MNVEKKAYSYLEASVATGLCVNTLRKLVKQGCLRAVKYNRRVLIPSAALDDFLKTEIGKHQSFIDRLTGVRG